MRNLSVSEFFQRLNSSTINLVDEFYDPACLFEDPVSHFTNRHQIKEYYLKLYNQVQSINFDFHQEVRQGDQYMGSWTMILQAKNFNSGKPTRVEGVSHITFGGQEGKAVYHRDYFDMGEFVYEWVPIIGPQVRFVKSIFINNHKPGR